MGEPESNNKVGQVISAKEAVKLATDPMRVIEFPLKKCEWKISEAVQKRRKYAEVYGGVFGGAKFYPPKASYLKILGTLEEEGFTVEPIGGFFRPGIRIKW